ncbi:type II secretion system F family protein [Clostridium sp. AF18-27]|uniref:Type IV pilus assembly protein PilC n=1 Tax=Enterocloster lavalensis TaxID=460384 RepID=A0A1I0JQK8_9FIRM|nr:MULTISPECIES: type II secretion system F family protein [Enterocloster]MCB6343442.1 type II secretion system F family protein [Enterocloster lavalensis]MDR3757288.1 type II secretion system F family protein [Enterocloster sp.]RHR48773.1 type II secretion system F family protein [Clostridium sp. AF18-27]SEU12865.1 type IV pilus assembly protein PilC [Enterocloster lavalensis]
MKKPEKPYQYSYQELSAFCLQIGLLLEAAVPLDEGLAIMAEDAGCEDEKQLLLYMAEGAELGDPFFKVLEDAGTFPLYVVRMAKLGQQSGTLDQMMKSLSDYYEKEYRLLVNVKNALTYPIMMVVMLLVVLFVLFSKVMPVFDQVYEQLGAKMSPAARSAIRLGGLFSGAALIAAAVIALAVFGIWAASRFGHRISLVDKMVNYVKCHSRIALAIANRRFTSVLALTLKSGMEFEKGLELAGELVDNGKVAAQIEKCGRTLETGASYYQAMKDTGLFSGFYVQMIKVGSRSGRLDAVMEEISEDFEQAADQSMDNMLARFEPTIVAVLAVSVGLVLLSVMLPLVGVLAAIG